MLLVVGVVLGGSGVGFFVQGQGCGASTNRGHCGSRELRARETGEAVGLRCACVTCVVYLCVVYVCVCVCVCCVLRVV
jgi:hypothetical protein